MTAWEGLLGILILKLPLHVLPPIEGALYGSGQELFHLLSPMPTTWKILSQYVFNEWIPFRSGLVYFLFSRSVLVSSQAKRKSSLLKKRTKWKLTSLVIFLPSDIRRGRIK